jgi:hypothetical protein
MRATPAKEKVMAQTSAARAVRTETSDPVIVDKWPQRKYSRTKFKESKLWAIIVPYLVEIEEKKKFPYDGILKFDLQEHQEMIKSYRGGVGSIRQAVRSEIRGAGMEKLLTVSIPDDGSALFIGPLKINRARWDK